jgi:hypothetical protein
VPSRGQTPAAVLNAAGVPLVAAGASGTAATAGTGAAATARRTSSDQTVDEIAFASQRIIICDSVSACLAMQSFERTYTIQSTALARQTTSQILGQANGM